MKSKKTKACAALLLAGPMFIGPVLHAYSQTASEQQAFGDLELRGAADAEGDVLTSDVEGGEEPRTQSGNRQITEETASIRTNNRVSRVTPQGRVGTSDNQPNASPLANEAVAPVQSGQSRAQEDDPFATVGKRVGKGEVFISLEQSAGYSSNISGNVGGEAGGFSQTEINANYTSDWSRHEFQSSINGSYRKPFDSDAVDEPSIDADMALRLDLIDGNALTAAASYSASTQEFTDTTLAPGAVDTPLTQSYGGSLELARQDRKLRYALRGAIERNLFEDADLGGGAIQSQEDQNNYTYSIGLRAGYEVSPALVSFVEGIYTIQDHDLEFDRNGNQRDSEVYELRAGIEVDLGEKVTGEIAGGFVTETFEDPALEDLSGFTLNGSLNWSPERGSLVGLTLATETNNSIIAGESGSLIYSGRIDYARQINHRLSMDAYAGVQVETNDDQNTTLEIGIGTQYWVNRFTALTADVDYSSFSSGAANSGFDEVSARLGVRLQN